MIRRFVIPLLLLAVGAAGLAALARSRPQPEPLDVQEKVWPVSTIAVLKSNLTPTITLYARVDSPRISTLTAAITADVVEVRALEGDRAEAGDVLVRLDGRDASLEQGMREAELKEIEADLAREETAHANDLRALELERKLLALIQRDVERARELVSREVGSAARLDEARQAEARQMLALDNRRLSIAEHSSRKAALEARAQRARALLARMKLDVERTVIKAPFSGPVANVSVSPGDRVRAGDRLLSMYDDQQLEFRAQIPTRHLSALRSALTSGRDVRAVALVDGVAIDATLRRTSAEVERGRGGSDAFFSIGERSGVTVDLGRTVELVVPLPAIADVFEIPAQALYGSNRIYVLEGDRMSGRIVKRVGERTAESNERRILIASENIDDGDRVIVTQLPNAVDGLKVRTVNARKAATSDALNSSD